MRFLLVHKIHGGLINQLDQVWMSNKAMPIGLLLAVIMGKVEEQIDDSIKCRIDRHNWIIFSAYTSISYVLCQRGGEDLLFDLEGLHNH